MITTAWSRSTGTAGWPGLDDCKEEAPVACLAGGFASTVAYDAGGNALSTRDPNNVGRDCTYDVLGRDVECTDTASHVTSSVYDRAGNKTQSIDAKENITYSLYDARGRLLRLTDRLEGITMFGKPSGSVPAAMSLRTLLLCCLEYALFPAVCRSEARLVVEPDSIEFRALPVGSVDCQSIRVTNANSADVTIERINSTCGCAEPDFGSATARAGRAVLKPGESTTVVVQVRPRRIGRQSGSLFFYATGDAQPAASVGISVIAVPVTPLRPNQIDFGEVLEGESKTVSVELRTTDETPINISRWRVDERRFSLDWKPREGAGMLTVTLKKEAAEGRVDATAICELGQSGEEVGAVALVGRVRARYELEPQAIDLSHRNPAAEPLRVIIRDRRGEPVEIGRVSCTVSGVETTHRTLSDGAAEVTLADHRTSVTMSSLSQAESVEIIVVGWPRPLRVPLIVGDVYTGRRLTD